MYDRLFLLWAFVIGLMGLGFIAYQTLRVVQIANEITQLILKTHP
jgi:hypothetical protein